MNKLTGRTRFPLLVVVLLFALLLLLLFALLLFMFAALVGFAVVAAKMKTGGARPVCGVVGTDDGAGPAVGLAGSAVLSDMAGRALN